MTWATKRKLIYTVILIGVLALFIYVPFLIIWQGDPTCSDGVKNQDEAGIDCGGACEYLCPSQARDPEVRWARVFDLGDGRYNALAYVENPNRQARLAHASYEFVFYGGDGDVLDTRQGTLTMPAESVVGVFEGRLTFDRKPARASFTFGQDTVWKRPEQTGEVVVANKRLFGLATSPRIDATIENAAAKPITSPIEVSAIVYDAARNPVGVSKTEIASLGAEESIDVSFTWPQPFATDVYVCSQPTDFMSVIDRSGSMAYDSKNPPQPLTDVKRAATEFVSQFSTRDKGGVVSFATEASDPIEATLTSDFDALRLAIDGISIKTPTVQHTNISDGLESALLELNSPRARAEAKSVMVLLTDGVATHPIKEGDEDYAKKRALEVAAQAGSSDITLYAIGLGEQVNPDFLKRIAASEEHYYLAPSADDLKQVYTDIATKICKEEPAVVEILPRIMR